MDYSEKIARYEEIERRGLLSQLPQETQEAWAEYKRRQAPQTEQQSQEESLTNGQRALSSLKHDIEDIVYGARRGLSGATLGGSEWALRKMGVGEDYIKNREAEGLGTAAKIGGFGAEVGGNIIGAGGLIAKGVKKAGLEGLKALSAGGAIEGAGYGATSSDKLEDLPLNVSAGSALGATMPFAFHYGLKPVAWAVNPILNKVSQKWNTYVNNKARQALTDSLASGEYADIPFGSLPENVKNQVNSIRIVNGEQPIDAKMMIPRGVVEKWGGNRLNENYTPERVAQIADEVFHSSDVNVSPTKLSHSQRILKERDGHTNDFIGFVSRNDRTGETVAKTVYQKPRRGSAGRQPASLQDSVGRKRLSDLQTPSVDNNITQNSTDVKQIDTKSFIEGLANEKSRRTMRNAVMSGAEDLADRAKVVADKLERRNSGMFDPDFEDLIKTPELKSAEESYYKFMNKNGKQQISTSKVNEFYDKNPIAKDLVNNAREIAPQKFSGVKHGSLREFDSLKQMLRKMKGNQSEKTVAQEAADIAEKDLKTLMDNEFKGFRDVNQRFADATTTQEIFESKLKKGLSSVGGATVSPFWSGISSPLAAAGAIGGYFNPASLAATAAGLGGKALMRYARRNAGRDIANGVVKAPVNINPLLNLGLTGASVNDINDFKKKERQLMIDLLNNKE